MQIHNLYSDILLSTRTLLDKYIFPPNFIKNYEFNLANRTFTLSKNDYKPNFSLPVALISFNNEQYSFGERTSTILNHTVFNNNKIPVLYDPLTSNAIYIQEEHTNVSTSVKINCESQFQAKEMEFTIKRILPLNKYINIFNFVSFLEIHSDFLLSIGMDFNSREIINLFTKFNRNLGQIEHCFSVNYNPLIRLESIDTSLMDGQQRTFQVNLELTYLMQMPMWFCWDSGEQTIERINVDFIRFGNEPISENSCRSIVNTTRTDKYDSIKFLTKRNLLIHDLLDYEFFQIHNEPTSPYHFAIQFTKEDFIISPNYQFNIFDINGKIHKDIKPTLIDTDLNKVIFHFTQDQYLNYLKPTITTPIIIQFIQVRD